MKAGATFKLVQCPVCAEASVWSCDVFDVFLWDILLARAVVHRGDTEGFVLRREDYCATETFFPLCRPSLTVETWLLGMVGLV